jgi:outer membrane protein OmpA-like peptidoglycan-associated protein
MSNTLIFGQCITFKGEVKDQVTGKPLASNIFVSSNGKKTKIGVSNDLGEFTVQIPCEAKTLLVEKRDFRLLTIPLNINTEKNSFFCNLTLIPLDKQLDDHPYSQSEQKDLVLDNASTKTNKKATRVFKALDAYTKEAIHAQICLFYTKNGEKKCFEVNKSKQEKVVFIEEDIVAFEATEKGYQSYNGNLIINQLDNNLAVYDIFLSKTQTFATFSLTNDIEEIEFFNAKKAKITLLKKENYLYASVNPNEEYSCKIKTKKSTFEKKITIIEGLNFASIIDETKPPEIPKPINETIIPKGVQIIYFEQSDFFLTKLAKTQLDSIRKVLIAYPKLKVKITGYTDNVGDPRLNETLSEYRAKVTLNYFTTTGIDSKRLKWEALGDKKPANPNDNEENKSKNRRVELEITDDPTIQN